MARKSKEDTRSRLWVFVAYPESLPENWLDIIADWHVPCCISPLHDKDINADGEAKKPHYHIVLQFMRTPPRQITSTGEIEQSFR